MHKSTKRLLNQVVADLSQAAAIIHQIHWYIRGTSFYTLHPKMDELMDELNDQLDEAAERLITIGGSPYSTLTEFLANTKLNEQEGSYDVSADDHVKRLVDIYQYLSKLYREGIDIAAKEEDPVTEDLFTGFKGTIDKNIWMLNSYLNKKPQVE